MQGTEKQKALAALIKAEAVQSIAAGHPNLNSSDLINGCCHGSIAI